MTDGFLSRLAIAALFPNVLVAAFKLAGIDNNSNLMWVLFVGPYWEVEKLAGLALICLISAPVVGRYVVKAWRFCVEVWSGLKKRRIEAQIAAEALKTYAEHALEPAERAKFLELLLTEQKLLKAEHEEYLGRQRDFERQEQVRRQLEKEAADQAVKLAEEEKQQEADLKSPEVQLQKAVAQFVRGGW